MMKKLAQWLKAFAEWWNAPNETERFWANYWLEEHERRARAVQEFERLYRAWKASDSVDDYLALCKHRRQYRDYYFGEPPNVT